MAGNRVTSEKMRRGNLGLHSLVSNVESEVFYQTRGFQENRLFHSSFPSAWLSIVE